ncbi:putative mitochondrial carrier protein [Botrytis fragariae]|uniref:Putative mitochondrial carrier protein n=1 Tax=Botrytis fragariae TaxID=1964551 RepID=A0A8H6ELL0_9HELO|nr:putative mitochondrial carrier protein [Botrytis fragariae]KAF5876659.1 putative mitochondrial carrier protein [Botrytis fragariae]
MSADFWAGYISGAISIIIGNPLDLLKVRLQASSSSRANGLSPILTPLTSTPPTTAFSTPSSLIRGTAAPILSTGALNALLFVTYNRTLSLLHPTYTPNRPESVSLFSTFLAGTIGGLCSSIVSTPTELIKCRAQLSNPPVSSLAIARSIVSTTGIRGLYFGGVVTALRDSIGYGFYFWSYELSSRLYTSYVLSSSPGMEDTTSSRDEAIKILLCGGVAGVVTWASVFPLDVVKTRLQTQILSPASVTETTPLLIGSPPCNPRGALEIARLAYHNEGMGVFFRGLGVCSFRAFIVNAAQWTAYEWIMRELGAKGGIDTGVKDRGKSEILI